MKILGTLVSLAFIAFVVIVGIGLLRSPGTPASMPADNAGQVALQPGSIPDTTVGQANEVSLASADGACRTVGDGYLESNLVFGTRQASHIHVSYWVPSSSEQRERDVILPGGRWQRDNGVGGYFWIFVDCTDAQVRQQVELHQTRKREELGERHAGWGDAEYFTRID